MVRTSRFNISRCDRARQQIAVAVEFENAVSKAALEIGYTSLRQKEKDTVIGFICGRDVYVSLPTGSSNSLYYAILPKVFDILRGKSSKSIAIVVSPLISVMKDQMHSLETKRAVNTMPFVT